MTEKLTLLLGNDHPEPKAIKVVSLSEDIAIGISSVVDKSMKTHNLVNNEDACGVYINDELNILLAMVADSHSGYVASHEAVKRFPEILTESLKDRAEDDIRQAYLDSVLSLSANLLLVGRKSGVTYPGEYHAQGDISASTFFSVLKFNGKFYAIGCGDSYTAIIRDASVNIMRPNCVNFLGYTNLIQKIKEEFYQYDNKFRAISEKYQEKIKADRDKVNELCDQEQEEMRKFDQEYTSSPLPLLDFNSDHVRNVIRVHEIPVISGDVIFQCTDGIELDRKRYDKIAPSDFITRAFKQRSVYDAVQEIFRGVQEREFESPMDNVAVTAIRI